MHMLTATQAQLALMYQLLCNGKSTQCSILVTAPATALLSFHNNATSSSHTQMLPHAACTQTHALNAQLTCGGQVQDPIGDALRASPCHAALAEAAEAEASCVQWGAQLDTDSEDELDLRWLRPPSMVHDTEFVVPHDDAGRHRVQRPTPDRVWHNCG